MHSEYIHVYMYFLCVYIHTHILYIEVCVSIDTEGMRIVDFSWMVPPYLFFCVEIVT